ncbi:MAG: hypothetical protein EOO42_17575 [Flavobacteriales bacterium]|nr:MAG: hypothetical protein EOO42_17575 [Flavobacteriales bacterium]
MKEKLEDIISKDILDKTLMLIGEHLDKGSDYTQSFIQGVIYLKLHSKYSKTRIEKALGETLSIMYGFAENPFNDVIYFINIPSYKKIWWTIEDKISNISLKNVASLIGTTIALHIILILNKTYNFRGATFSSAQYLLLLNKSRPQMRYRIAYESEIRYFNYFPEWTPNAFYIVYLILFIAVIILWNKKSNAQ